MLKSTSDKKSTAHPAAPVDKDKARAEPKPALNTVWQSLTLSPLGVQTKLTVGQPDDPHEQEADRVAERVMRMTLPTLPGADAPPADPSPVRVQRNAKYREDDEQKLRPSSEPGRRGAEFPAPPIVHDALKSSGRPLEPELRSFFEPRFGYDLSSVRIHTDAVADESARAVWANAYTVGEHIAFRSGQYSPDTEAGRFLVAHELTHVVQQGVPHPAPVAPPAEVPQPHHTPKNGNAAPSPATSPNGNGHGLAVMRTPILQRSPGPDKPKTGGAVIEYELGDVTVHIWQDQGLMALSLAGEPWVTVIWTPGARTVPKLTLHTVSLSNNIGVEVESPFDIAVTVSTNTEFAYASRMLGGAVIAHKYSARGHNVTVNKHLPEGKLVLGSGPTTTIPQIKGQGPSHSETNVYDGRQPTISIEGLPIEPAPPIKMQPFWWEFNQVEQLDRMAAAHPQFYWVGLHPQAGKMRALNFTEEALYDPIERFREDPEVAAGVFKFYENGTAWTDLDPLYYMFFRNASFAAYGAPGDSPECVVFTHGKHSFGRVSLAHDEALRLWLELEKYATTKGADKMTEIGIENVGKFHELVVAGKTSLHYIDAGYFRVRDVVLANADLLKQNAGSSSSWSELFKNDPSAWWYTSVALDRDEAFLDPQLASVIDSSPGFAAEAGERIYERVERYASLTATTLVNNVKLNVQPFLDDYKLRSTVLNYPFWDPTERRRTLTFIGLPEDFQNQADVVLASAENAQMVAMGETVNGVSLETLKAAVQEHVNELQSTLEQLADANILLIEGEFGNEIRKTTYEHFGFKLSPYHYPHEDEAAQRDYGRHPIPDRSIFGTEAGYLFAKESAARARSARKWKIIKIIAVVAASVVLVIVSAGAGLAVAGLAIGAETAGAAFAAFTIEVLVSSAIVTAVGPAVNTFIMTGGSLDPAVYKKAYSGIGWQFLMNVATFGFFKGLTVGIEAAAVAGAGGKAAFDLSKGWQAANTASRIALSGSAMFGISIVTHRLQSGKWPEGETLNEIFLETGLSILMLEVGSALTRPSMLRIQDWARTQRIGADLVVEMKAIQTEVTAVNREAAKYGADPIGKKQTGLELLGKQETLLNRKKAVIDELNKSFRTRPDAKALERMLAPELGEINARLAEIRGIVAFEKAEVRPAAAGGAGDVAEYTYKRGKEKVLKDYFGEKNVVEVAGHLEVMVGGPTGKKLIFRPATDTAAGILPDGTRSPDALNAWRRNATERIRAVLAEAETLAANDPVLREVATADPSTMDLATMTAFEKKLARAEKNLTDLKMKTGTLSAISIERDSASLETWRIRLVQERERLMNRAKLLGLENNPLVKKMSSLPMGRSADPTKPGALKEATIKNYRDAIEAVQKLITQGRTDKLAALDQQTGGTATPLADLQAKLSDRRADIIRRAKLFQTTKSQYILDVKGLAIGGTKKYSSLSRAEEIIAKAEAKLDAYAKKALDDAVTLHGADVITKLRAGAGLELLTDAQVGDVMRQLGTTTKLSAEALRGAVLASYAADATTPISIKRIVSLARSTAELEFSLTTFGMLRDAQVGGSFRLLRDGVASADKWKGAVWQMKLARMVIGIDKIRSFEVTKTTGTGNRVTDILLLDGQSVEAKDWSTWTPDKVDQQFFRDLEIHTVDGAVASGMEKIKWLFNDPPPVSIKDIRATMKATLDRFIVNKGLSKTQADALRDAFDAHTGLVDAPKLGFPETKPPVQTPKKPTVPLPPVQKDDQE